MVQPPFSCWSRLVKGLTATVGRSSPAQATTIMSSTSVPALTLVWVFMGSPARCGVSVASSSRPQPASTYMELEPPLLTWVRVFMVPPQECGVRVSDTLASQVHSSTSMELVPPPALTWVRVFMVPPRDHGVGVVVVSSSRAQPASINTDCEGPALTWVRVFIVDSPQASGLSRAMPALTWVRVVTVRTELQPHSMNTDWLAPPLLTWVRVFIGTSTMGVWDGMSRAVGMQDCIRRAREALTGSGPLPLT